MLKQILWTACITPFDKKGAIEYQVFAELLQKQSQSGNGVLLLGSTGEGLSLSEEEKRTLITFACELDIKVPLIVGIAGLDLGKGLELLDFCKDLPIQGHLLTTPIYAKPGVRGQIDWFEKLLNRAAHPAILYNVPGRAGVRLHTEAVKHLKEHKRAVAIKDSGGTLAGMIEYRTVAPDIAIFAGDDYILPAMAIEGACGLISVASNAWPASLRRYVKHSLAGHKVGSPLFWEVSQALFSVSNPVPLKALMRDVGLIPHDGVRLPLSAADLPSRKPLLSYHERILNWQPNI